MSFFLSTAPFCRPTETAVCRMRFRIPPTQTGLGGARDATNVFSEAQVECAVVTTLDRARGPPSADPYPPHPTLTPPAGSGVQSASSRFLIFF